MSEHQAPAIQLVRPFLKGIEKNSVLIDITDVKSPVLLRQALQDFNKEALADKGYEEYCGRLPTIRKYLNRSFIETIWSQGSKGQDTILNQGISLPDGTYIKGFKSYPADSRITRITLDKLPLKPLILLKKDMEEHLSAYGQVLDLGVSMSNGCFMGQGYATLDISVSSADQESNIPLQRIMNWVDDDGDDRQVLLQWEDMPDFCRLCQLTGHCRADCPDYKKFLKCHNCNCSGHVMRNCPRNNDTSVDIMHNKKRSNKQRNAYTKNIIQERYTNPNTTHAESSEDMEVDNPTESTKVTTLNTATGENIVGLKGKGNAEERSLVTEDATGASTLTINTTKSNLLRSPLPDRQQEEAAKISKFAVNADISTRRKPTPSSSANFPNSDNPKGLNEPATLHQGGDKQ
ncbi:uncharacterized protein EV154DRAFT_459460 [Mucor mucedo]|uniref:uncharacterized protein n=1 Tax=Mucor mucedo TaxID=29922 RepID=UPI00221FDA1A|nr:uncharacterized protein EV154DRAFT_459460 [Mucor mucedo]KAI7894433.1 hypothetical protein EV154DRAFT_459460 [Mucor mucedo]